VDEAVEGTVDNSGLLGVTDADLWTMTNLQKNHEKRLAEGLRRVGGRDRNSTSPGSGDQSSEAAATEFVLKQ
jgi:hypothetical protein